MRSTFAEGMTVPSGEIVKNLSDYMCGWTEFIRELSGALGGVDVIGFDPDIAFTRANSNRGVIEILSLQSAIRVIEHYRRVESWEKDKCVIEETDSEGELEVKSQIRVVQDGNRFNVYDEMGIEHLGTLVYNLNEKDMLSWQEFKATTTPEQLREARQIAGQLLLESIISKRG